MGTGAVARLKSKKNKKNTATGGYPVAVVEYAEKIEKRSSAQNRLLKPEGCSFHLAFAFIYCLHEVC